MTRAKLATLMLLVPVASCITSGPRQTKLMKTSKMTVSAAELRVEVSSGWRR